MSGAQYDESSKNRLKDCLAAKLTMSFFAEVLKKISLANFVVSKLLVEFIADLV